MRPQLFESRNGEKPIPRLLKPIPDNDIYPHGKPPANCGLWTSTYLNPWIGSEWIKWNNLISVKQDSFKQSKFYLLCPEKTIKVYTITTSQDLRNLVDQYPNTIKDYPEAIQKILKNSKKREQKIWGLYSYPNWKNISKDYDAIHLTKKGVHQTRWINTKHPELYLLGWDCESTFWFRWKFQKVKRLPFPLWKFKI